MSNVYSAPSADMSAAAADAQQTYDPTVFALKGRIGRLRYAAYSFGLIMAASIIVGLVAGLTFRAKYAVVLVLVAYIPMIVVSVVMGVRRLNDLDLTGWLSPLILVPLVNILFGLYLMFAPGTAGANKYGPAPAQNSRWVVIGGLALPGLIFLVGILAAIAIPAYQDYVQRAGNGVTQR